MTELYKSFSLINLFLFVLGEDTDAQRKSTFEHIVTNEAVCETYLHILKVAGRFQINLSGRQLDSLGDSQLTSIYSSGLLAAAHYENEKLLKKEFEDELIREWIKGSPDARNKMMLYIVPLCKSVICHTSLMDNRNKPVFSVGDAMSCAYKILEKNLGKSFNVSYRLYPWLWKCVKNELVHDKQKMEILKTISLDDPAYGAGESNGRDTKVDSIPDIDLDNERIFLENQKVAIIKCVNMILDKMEPDFVKVLKAHVYERRNFDDLGKEYGLSASTVRRRFNSAIKNFRAEYAKVKADYEKQGDDFPLECAKLPNFPYALEILQFSVA